jgi:hypothetical protein
MIFKHKETGIRCILLYYSVEGDKVTLGFQDKDLDLTFAEFHINYEYVWMSHK